jgi:hypothetical protein
MTSGDFKQGSINEAADFWRYDIGVNVIPAETKNKKTSIQWSEYQDTPISEWQHEKWKKEGKFDNGTAIIPGKIWHREGKKGLYFVFLDADRRLAIDELCTRNGLTITLQEMAKKILVEQHEDDLDKAHLYFYSPIAFPKKSADSVLGLEVKGSGEHGIAFCSPSVHKDGKPYQIIGTNQPIVITKEQAREMIQHINQICMKHGLEYLEKDSSIEIRYKLRKIIKGLVIDTAVKIPQGRRHTTLISIADSLLFNHLGKGKKESEKRLKDFVEDINRQLCEPMPLPESELNNIWESALGFVQGIREEQKQEEGNDEETQDRRSQAQIMLELALENISVLFKDQYGVPHAQIQIDTHHEIMKVDSSKFR